MGSLLPGGFGTPTNEDGRPWLWFMSIIGCSYSMLALAARFMAKWEALGIEDAFIGLSYVFAIIYWALFDRSLWDGLGQSRHTAQLEEASTLFWTSWVILLLAIYLGKISVLLFERRLFVGLHKKTSRAFYVVIGFTAVCGIVSVVISSAGCNFDGFFKSPPDTCSSFKARNITVLVIEVVTELIIVIMPAYLVAKSMMPVEKKITVAILFSFRLICIPFMAAATTTLTSFAAGDGNRAESKAITAAAIWTQVVLGWSISSASIPCIKSFLAAFEADTVMNPMSSLTGSGNHHSRAHQMSSSRNNKASQLRSQNSNIYTHRGGPPKQLKEDDVVSLNSDGSQRNMIGHGIERKVDIDVVRESRPGSTTAGNASQKSMIPGTQYEW